MALNPDVSTSWTTPGAKDAMARTYAAVKEALKRSGLTVRHDIEVFLQGSYANSTNIRGDSDVDIVVMLKSSWSSDKNLLNAQEIAAYERDHSPATYTPKELRGDVIGALNVHFGNERVNPKNKAIRVNKVDGYVDADVVPALQHRLYFKYDKNNSGGFVEGTKLFPVQGSSIVNYPKVHALNGTEKNKNSRENFKPTVRQIKQLKRRAVKSGRIDPNKVPGYLIECMTFNVPDYFMVEDHHERLINVLRWLKDADFTEFKSVDTIHRLFKNDPGNFSPVEAKIAVLKMIEEANA